MKLSNVYIRNLGLLTPTELSCSEMFTYIGKASDGNFYWVIYYINPFYGLTNIHVCRKVKINGKWRNEVFVSGVEKIKALLKSLPREVANTVRKILNEVKNIFTLTMAKIQDIYDAVEYAADVIRAVRNILTTIDESFQEVIDDVKDRVVRERLIKALRLAIDRLNRAWLREVKKLDEKWELPSNKSIYGILEDAEFALRNVLNTKS